MSVLVRLAQRALGTPAPVRAQLGGRFDGAGPAIDPEAPVEEVVPLAVRAPVVAAARIADPREPAKADTFDRGVPVEPPIAAPSRDLAASRIEVGEQVEALMRAAAVALDQPPREVGGRDDAAAADRRDDVVAPPIPAPSSLAPEPFRPLLPPVETPHGAAGVRPLVPPGSPAAADQRDIRISIGRIEVRGEPSRRGPATPASPPPSRLMSLEDYLGKARRR